MASAAGLEGQPEPEWEPLTSKEWEAYRDHVRTISETVPGTTEIYESLPGATPTFASDALVEASLQPYAPTACRRISNRWTSLPTGGWTSCLRVIRRGAVGVFGGVRGGFW